jgi:HK97 family phage major capsid protein
MNKLLELRQKKADAVKRMREMLDKAEADKRSLTAEEETEYAALDTSLDQLAKDIEREERLQEHEKESRRIINPLPEGIISGAPAIVIRTQEVDPEKEFRNIGEYFFAMAALKRDGRRDSRLDTLREKREQTMGTGATGGFALPIQFDSTIRQIVPQASIVRPRAAVIAPGTPPDGKLEFPALDQTSAQNIYGGVVVTHTGEGVTMTETTARLRDVSVEPKEITAYIVVTNKLLNNWDAASSFVQTQMARAMAGTEDYDFMRGDGINKALGFINCAAAIAYPRAGANAIAWADVYNMFARMKMGGSLVWIASQTIIPQLAAMVDAGNHAVWISGTGQGTGAAQQLPSTLMGIPLIFADRAPALGSRGDLSLVDLSFYLIKDGSGPFAASADQLLFLSNKTVFKLVWNVDGKPWLTEPIVLEGSSTSTVSPFVVLL